MVGAGMAEPKTQRRREPEQRRSRQRIDGLLAATCELITEQGIGPPTLTDIARRAELSLTAVYRYFPNKQAIIRELAVRTLEQDRQVIVFPLLNDERDVGILIRAGIEHYRQRNVDEPFRPHLRNAIRADAELAQLDFADSQENAHQLARRIAAGVDDADIEQIRHVVLLCLVLLGDVVDTATRLPADEADQIVETFIGMIIQRIDAALDPSARP